MKTFKSPLAILGLIAISFVMTGCKDPNEDLVTTSPSPGPQSAEYSPTALAGVGKNVDKSKDPNRLKPLYTARNWGHRDNPFALTSDEIAYDRQQTAERFISEGQTFGSLWELQEATNPESERVAPEPQPYRRLSGILIGDSILAILEEGGRSTIIRPGMRIPDTEWTVVAIDRDKAVLRRGGNRLPKEVEVRLEIGMPGTSGSSGFNPGPGNAPQGGPPRGGSGGGPGGSRPD